MNNMDTINTDGNTAINKPEDEMNINDIVNITSKKLHEERLKFKQELAEKDKEIEKLQFENKAREIFSNKEIPFSIFQYLNCSDEESLNSALQEILLFTENRLKTNIEPVLSSARPVGANPGGNINENGLSSSNIRKAMGIN